MHTYIYIYIYICVHTYVCIYIYIYRERDIYIYIYLAGVAYEINQSATTFAHASVFDAQLYQLYALYNCSTYTLWFSTYTIWFISIFDERYYSWQ